MLDYAQKVFDESFDKAAIIEEDRLTSSEFLADAYIDPQPLPAPHLIEQLKASNYQNLEEYHRAQYQLWFNTSLDADYQESSWRVELGDRLKSLPLIHNLLKILDKYKVIELGELWQELV
ncbi:MAG: hypothetical protein RLZZ148_2262, partial [Cyanobacteriota bacterium]